MSPDRFSKAQREAVSHFASDVCVRAGAGSGKTSVLVGRFVAAVTEHDVAPDGILAITFTEKAANEIKSRLVQQFSALKREDLRRALETAYIGTIHGFCQRLLRENPIEAGVDPYFKVLSEGESDILMAKAMDTVFEAQAGSPVWLNILVERGEEKVRSALLDFYAHFRASGEEESLLAVKGGAGRQALEARLKDGLARKAAEIGPDPEAKTDQAILEAAHRIPAAFSRPLEWASFGDVRSAAGAIALRKHKEWVEDFRRDVRRWTLAALQDLFMPQKQEFVRVFRAFRETYESQKRASAMCDFDDLPYLAWKTLSGDTPEKKAVRARYQAKFRHIFVDEFQDTNPLQAKLIQLLRREGNLFIVGDPQQSIYAFRHAEPSLFARHEAEAGKKIELAENYRSRRAILDFTNSFFAGPGSPFHALRAEKKFRSRGEGKIELSCAYYGEGEEAADLDAARQIEAAALGARIRELVDSGTPVESKDGSKTSRPMRYGDVAVLMRSTRKAAIYERAFARAGVPFYSVKSRGFFERPEVKDFVGFLALLDHPEDDVALAAVLRSPIVGVSDDGLFWLARFAKAPDKDAPLAAAVEVPGRVQELSSAERAKVEAFAAFLNSVRARKNRLAVSALIEEAVSWSAYECAALAGPLGEQRVANVRKLVEMARSLEEKTAVDASEFVRYVRGLAERDDAEAEARIEGEGGDAVLLASIHAAKGLEFPCVVLADLGGKNLNRSAGLVTASTEEGVGWSMPDPDDNKEPLRDHAHETVNTVLRARNDEEADRLFYVAATRAKEFLIFSGASPRDDHEKTWMGRLLAYFKGKDSAELREAHVVRTPLEGMMSGSAVSASGITAEGVLARTCLPVKSYDLAMDVAVTALLASEKPSRSSDGTGMSDDVPPFEAPVSEEPESVDPEDLERTPRNEFGTLFHRLMEAGVRSCPRGKVSAEFAERLLAPLTPVERGEAKAAAAFFWKGEWGKTVSGVSACHPELPFIYKTRFGILKGQIDLVFHDDKLGWTILDYKTSLIGPGEAAAAAREYEFQIGLYALVFKKLYGMPPARGVLYFSTTGESVVYPYTETDFKAFEERLNSLFSAMVSARTTVSSV